MASFTLDQPPPPGDLKIGGRPESAGMSSHQWNRVGVRAKIRKKNGESGQIRLVVDWSTHPHFMGGTGGRVTSGWGGERSQGLIMTGVPYNTQIYVRAYCQQRGVSLLSGPNSTNFWTERSPLAPVLVNPPENSSVQQEESVALTWEHRDADTPPDGQAFAQVQWRVAGTATTSPGPFSTRTIRGSGSVYNTAEFGFLAGTFYEWRARTADVHGETYGPWSDLNSFYVIGANRAPRLDYPINGVAVSVDEDITFEWTFRDPSGDSQIRADLRYRVAGTENWTTLNGDGEVPGAESAWTISPGVFHAGYRYEWQVRTIDDSPAAQPSDWSESGFFHSIRTPGWQVPNEGWLGETTPAGALGAGTYRVFAYDRGGQRIRGEITPLARLRWHRLRDDISSALLTTNGFGDANCQSILGDLRTWAHEIVVFRDDERVWEGPVTRIAYMADSVEIEARDPMYYVYRRIMRQGYNDNYRRDPRTGLDVGTRSVVDRAAIIIANALAPDDPNVLPWLTRYDYDDDARESRSVLDWSKTAWEEVDALAATAGLDYTTVGRRIILIDTHRAVGRLGEMREHDFFQSPVITEYGASAANVFGVTNNSGLYGYHEIPRDERYGLGPIEMLASEYGESGTSAIPGALTPAQRARKQENLSQQAERNMSGRWPPPLVVRIPDNSRMSPKAAVGINQLVPGVHIPLRAVTPCREFAQVQKLDALNVEVLGNEEHVRVVMSPAPRAGVDPDADSAAELEA